DRRTRPRSADRPALRSPRARHQARRPRRWPPLARASAPAPAPAAAPHADRSARSRAPASGPRARRTAVAARSPWSASDQRDQLQEAGLADGRDQQRSVDILDLHPVEHQDHAALANRLERHLDLTLGIDRTPLARRSVELAFHLGRRDEADERPPPLVIVVALDFGFDARPADLARRYRRVPDRQLGPGPPAAPGAPIP